jgi:fructokinase
MPSRVAPVVLCFGEILWDFLPDGLFPGGAPFNVAYHLHQQRLDARVVSAVGRDVLGDELLRRLAAWKIPTHSIARLDDRPTGVVRAEIAARGDAHYTIATDVAWDAIALNDATLEAASHARALIFGTLALRGPANRRTLDRLFAALPADALRVFDVNLRPPHDDFELARALARVASVLKLNAAEAARLAADEAETPGREEAHARVLALASGCSTVCVTAGERGAGLLRDNIWHWEKGRAVEVADTVGSGDAFLASLVASMLSGHGSEAEWLARACRLGEWVATQRGGTPGYSREAKTITA